PTVYTPISSRQMAQVEVSQSKSGDTLARVSGSNFPAAPKAQPSRLAGPLNGYKVVVEDNDDGLPDLGRFPAEWQYRQPNARQDLIISAGKDDVSSNIIRDSSLAQPATSEHRPVPQPRLVQTPKGNTFWPVEKRKALAETAVNLLLAMPANRDKKITAQTIIDI